MDHANCLQQSGFRDSHGVSNSNNPYPRSNESSLALKPIQSESEDAFVKVSSVVDGEMTYCARSCVKLHWKVFALGILYI